METQIEQLAKEYQANAANEVPIPSVGQCKAIFANNKAPTDETTPKRTNELHEIYFIYDDNVQVSKKKEEGPPGVLPCQLPLKELNPGSFTLPCTIGSLNLYATTDLGANAPVGIVENALVKIDKFLFPSDFMIIDMLGDPSETMILGRPFLATIHARIDAFNKEILLGVGEDRIVFYMNGNVHHPAAFVKKEQYEGEKGMTTMAESETTASRLHYCKKLQECNCDDERQNKKGKEILFLDLLLIKYENKKIDDTVREKSFDVEVDFARIRNDSYSRSLDEYKAVFDNEIEQLANEYELRIKKKGYIMDNIWEKYEQVHGGTLYSWHDDGFEEEERWESGLDGNLDC
ncbi:7-deoxyloganetin glucosyltransferase-like protein [Tanacetum coccineum]